MSKYPWFEDIYKHVEYGQPARGLLVLVSHVNELLADDDIAGCDEVARTINLGKLDENLVAGLLGYFSPVRERMVAYIDLFERVQLLLCIWGTEDADSLLYQFAH